MHRACCSAGDAEELLGHRPALRCGRFDDSEPEEEEDGGGGCADKAPGTPLNGECTPRWMPALESICSEQDGSKDSCGGGVDLLHLGEQGPSAAAEAKRRVQAFRVFLRLVGSSVECEDELEKLLMDITSEEFAQIAEERGLAGRCGSPLCSSAIYGYRGKSRSKAGRDGSHCYCSLRCKEYVERWICRLSNPFGWFKESLVAEPADAVEGHLPTTNHKRQPNKWQNGCPSAHQCLEADTIPLTYKGAPVNTAAVEGYLPGVDPRRQPVKWQTECAGTQKRLGTIAIPRTYNGASVAGVVDLAQLDQLDSDEDEGYLQQRGWRQDSAGAEEDSPVHEQPTPALGLQRYSQDADEFPRVVDLGPEYGGLHVVDKPYLNVTGGPLQVGGSNRGGEYSADGSTDSDNGGDSVAFFELPSPGLRVSTLSTFGRLYMALDSWVTPETLRFLHHGLKPDSGDVSTVQDCQALQVLSGHMNRALVPVIRRLRVKTVLCALEKDVAGLLSTFKFDCPLPCLSAAEWQVIVAAALRGLSVNVRPSLKVNFEGRQASERVAHLLTPVGLDGNRFDGLAFVFSADREY
eukprot:evm.model.scf_887.9 EVM.evm.TU.scf_887.9   scf_887:45718-50100(-)